MKTRVLIAMLAAAAVLAFLPDPALGHQTPPGTSTQVALYPEEADGLDVATDNGADDEGMDDEPATTAVPSPLSPDPTALAKHKRDADLAVPSDLRRPADLDDSQPNSDDLRARQAQADQAAESQEDHEIEAEASGPDAAAPASPPGTEIIANRRGLAGRNVVPSDATGAIGTDHYVEMVNSGVAVYRRRDLSRSTRGRCGSSWRQSPASR